MKSGSLNVAGFSPCRCSMPNSTWVGDSHASSMNAAHGKTLSYSTDRCSLYGHAVSNHTWQSCVQISKLVHMGPIFPPQVTAPPSSCIGHLPLTLPPPRQPKKSSFKAPKCEFKNGHTSTQELHAIKIATGRTNRRGTELGRI